MKKIWSNIIARSLQKSNNTTNTGKSRASNSKSGKELKSYRHIKKSAVFSSKSISIKPEEYSTVKFENKELRSSKNGQNKTLEQGEIRITPKEDNLKSSGKFFFHSRNSHISNLSVSQRAVSEISKTSLKPKMSKKEFDSNSKISKIIVKLK